MSRKAMHGRAVFRTLLFVAVVAVAVALLFGWHQFKQFSSHPLHVAGQNTTIDVDRGSSFTDIVASLRQEGLTRASPVYWRVLAGQMHVTDRLHAGQYAVPVGTTPRQLLAKMAAGKVVQHNFTIVDGWTFAQLRHALAGASQLKQKTASLDNAQIMQRIGAGGEDPEGRFLPETYAWVKGDSDLDVLKRSHEAMNDTLKALWADRAPNLPLDTPYDALKLASIVEKETGRADERARIAGVFIRRLRDHMLLQTDPSVIYGMGAKYTGNIRKSDLTTDTPYNTYTRPGLPPTPIALPGKPALEAALHPATGTALYFVARGDGSHVFADTLAEQNHNVDCYQRKRCR